MRTFDQIIQVFLCATVAISLQGCEEEQPKKLQVVDKPIESLDKVALTPPVLPPVSLPKVIETQKPSPPVPTGTDVHLLEETRAALNQGKNIEGLTLAEKAIKQFPERSATWNLYGRAQLKNGLRKPSIESFAKAVKLNPNSSYALNNLGLALIYDGQFERAVSSLESATEQTPVESYMWNNLGMAYEHVDRLSDARRAYREAVELESQSAQENLTRLQGVKSIRTAKNDTISSDVVTVDHSDEHTPLDGGFLDGGE